MTMKVLFILKYRELDYNGDGCETKTWAYANGLSSGLLNSARFVNNMLNTIPGIESNLVQVNDNNDIDREVTKYKPTHVIIEAYWVVPEKFQVLTRLHPKVKWIIRNHSNVPFLANEGIAFGWTIDYLKIPNVFVSCNHTLAQRDFQQMARSLDEDLAHKLVYLPNYYPLDDIAPKPRARCREVLDIGCFGAIRPLKNHMTQALAAIEYARQHNKHLKFHINGNRVEGNGGPILKNLRELFKRTPNADLVEHSWLDHQSFLNLVGSMDMGLQVSYTETFNIVAADFVAANVPVVTSSEIFWIDPFFYANVNDVSSMIRAMNRVTAFKKFMTLFNHSNRLRLNRYNKKSKLRWVEGLIYVTL